jgi:UDP-N-acetylmuramate dehydrogenase
VSPTAERNLETLKGFFGSQLSQNVPLNRHCTFRIGGPAEYFVTLSSTAGLPQALEFCHEEDIPVTILGWGSNVLLPDQGLEGVVVKVVLDEITFCEEMAAVQAGVTLGTLARAAAQRGLTGLEFASGIPGTIGGAVMINAGLGEECIGDMVESVSGYDITGRGFSIDGRDIDFGYRSSSLCGTAAVVTDVTLTLARDDPERIRERMAAYGEKRREAQPLEYPSAGSVFRNPPGERAWKLIEDAGCRGFRVGNAQVSEKHSNFIVNLGGATYEDVSEIIEAVIDRVRDTSGITLELEIVDMGTSQKRKKEL